MPVMASKIRVDDIEYAVHFQGFDAPLHVQTSTDSVIKLQPWYFTDYLSSLGRCIHPVADGLKLDSECLTREVLSYNNIPISLQHELTPIALWWAIGGEHKPVKIKSDEMTLGEYEFRIRSWTAKERMEALAKCLNEPTTDSMEFDFIQYIELMIRASVIRITPSINLEDLNAARTSELLEVVTLLNVAESLTDEIAVWGSTQGLQQMLQSTLHLCKVLGWGPSQIWSLPAAEIDRLMAMLELLDTSGTKKTTAHSSGFASDPNAVVINIVEDE